MKTERSGFILVLTIMLVSSSVLLISLVVNRVSAYRRMGRLWVDIEKSKLIALSGLEIAMSQIAQLDAEPKEEGESSDKKPERSEESPSRKSEGEKDTKKDEKKQAEKAKKLLDFLMNKLNSWQTFEIKEAVEGVDGTSQIYISSEQGKINLGGLYDPQQKKFVTAGTVTGKQLCDFISEKLKPIFERKKQKAPELASLIEKFFKEHQSLDDVSQLFAQADSQAQMFVRPEGKDKDFALTDLFTTETQKNAIDPFTFSASLCKVVGLTRTKDPKKIDPKALYQLIQTEKIDWQKMWNPAMVALYGKEYSTLPLEIKPFFDTRFGPTIWSVVSYGKVGSVTSKVCAIIEKTKNASEPFQVKKLYWL